VADLGVAQVLGHILLTSIVRAGPGLRPQIGGISRCPADLQADEMVLLVVWPQGSGRLERGRGAVVDEPLIFQAVGVAGWGSQWRRLLVPRIAAPQQRTIVCPSGARCVAGTTDRLVDVVLGDARIDGAGSARRIG